MIKASVIIPAYNVELYIDRCLQSVRSQDYENIEIIVIDDGSTDRTSEIIDRFAAEDERIIAIHQKNKGALIARSEGVKNATGEYAFFVDSDDWINPNMISSLIHKAINNKSDIVFSGLVRINDDLRSIKRDADTEIVYTGEDFAEFYKYIFDEEKQNNTGAFLSVWAKCIKTSLLKQIDYSGLNKLSFYEDTSVLLACCILAKSITIVPDAYYCYFMRNDSATHCKNDRFLSDLNSMYLYVTKMAENSPYVKYIREGLDVFFVDQCVRGLSIYYDLNDAAQFPYYLYPGKIWSGARLVIYGAGRVGRAFYQQFSKASDVDIVAWVDKNPIDCKPTDYPISAVDKICEKSFDILVIAVRYEEMAMQIRETLINDYGLDAKKIVWKKPIGILDMYIRKTEKDSTCDNILYN